MAVIRFFQRLLYRILLIDHEPPPPPEYETEEQPAETPEHSAETTPSRGAETSPSSGRIHVIRQSRADYAQMPIVIARPRNMEDATAVADRVKDRVPVVMNLEGVDESMVRRIVDFVGGVVFALDGALKKTGRAVYVCSPVDIPLEELRVTALPRRTTVLDFGSAPEEAQQMAL